MQATESLKDVPLFKGLSEDTLYQLESSATLRRIDDGEVYLSAGQPFRAFCVVVSGQLKLYRINRAGKEQIFGYVRANDVFGTPALTDPFKASPFNVVARMTSEILEIDLPMIRDLMQRDAALTVALLREQSRRCLEMLDMVDQLSLKDAHNRLARWLDTWIESNHPDAGESELQIVLPYTQSEIAAQIGTVREVVSRGFSRMEREGMLQASGKRITVLSRKRLRQMGEA
jgi:CRP-like cAMP-binding protein